MSDSPLRFATDGPLPVSRLVADETGVTRFVDTTIPWESGRGRPGTATNLLPATDVGFLKLPVNMRSDWHPAPRKQYVMVLEGIMEVEAGDGERRRFSAGSVLLVTDTEGPGHRTNVLGDQDVLLVWVPVP